MSGESEPNFVNAIFQYILFSDPYLNYSLTNAHSQMSNKY